MVDSDKLRFAFAITAMLELFGEEATKARLHGYWLGLLDLSIEQVERAVAHCMQHAKSKKLPLPYELRESIGVVIDDDSASLAAWDNALKALPLGPYKHVDFQDKTINAVIRHLGGWVTFIDRFQDSESEKWTRIEFMRAYKNMRHTGVSGDATKPLPGLSQASVVNGAVVDPIPRLVACDITRGEVKLIGERFDSEVRKLMVTLMVTQ